jgi:hypothetical protein
MAANEIPVANSAFNIVLPASLNAGVRLSLLHPSILFNCFLYLLQIFAEI